MMKSMNIFFKNIRTINPNNNLDEFLNIWLINGKIVHLSNSIPQLDNETEIIDGSQLVCAPGFIDMHVHLREPGFEYKEDIESGTNSAANGGYTAVVCMPNTNPCIDNAQTVGYIQEKSKNLLTDVYLSAAVTLNREGKQLSPMYELNDMGVLFFTDDGDCIMDTSIMRRAFEYAGTKDLLIAQHCEDHYLTQNFAANESIVSNKLGLKGFPAVAEEIIINRDIMLAEYLGNKRYHAQHISTKGAVNMIRAAKKRGLNVTCEVTPHHFFLTDEVLINYDTRHKMSPPLRTQDDIDAIIEGLIDGTIDCIASDHAPHALHEKHVEFDRAPHGIIGLETMLAISLDALYHKGKLSLNQIVEKMSINPRKILKLPKIEFQVGQSANMTIFEPNETWIVNKLKFKSKSKNTPFNNFQLKGKPKYTINNNKIHKCDL